MISLNSTQMMSIIRALTSINQCHGRQEMLKVINTVIATTMAQATLDGSLNLIETKLTQIKLVTMNHGSNSMNCYLDPMELPRPIHRVHLILQIDATLTQIAIGHPLRMKTQSLLIRHSAHLQYQAQLLRVHLAPRPIRIVL